MKRFTLLLCCSIFFLTGFANTKEPKKLTADVTAVTLFPESAQVTRNATTWANPGEQIIVFQNISPFIDTKSTQVKIKGNATLLAVTHQMNYLNKREKHELEAHIEKLTDSIDYYNTKLDILASEEAFLLENQSIKGTNSNITLSELQSINQYFTSKYSEIEWHQRSINAKIESLKQNIADLKKQLSKINLDYAKLTTEVSVKISSKVRQSLDFEITYITEQAGWYPTYDIRTKDVNSPVKLNYKANVHQNTGENWENVNLAFSNAANNTSNSLPNLPPWYLSYNPSYSTYEYDARPMMRSFTGNSVTGTVTDSEDNEPLPGVNVMVKGTTIGAVTDLNGNFEIQVPDDATTLVFSYVGYMQEELPINNGHLSVKLISDVMELQEVVVTGYGGQPGLLELLKRNRSKKQEQEVYQGPEVNTTKYSTFVNFKVEEKYTIPSNGENYTIDIAQHELNAEYEYHCIPKIDDDAFLLAKITDWQELNLLDGEVNLFFEDTYVGRSLINTRVLSDTMLLSLGRDQNITVERVKSKENSGTSLLGGKRINNQAWKIKIMNNKNQDINLTIYDQIPVSQRDDIKVSLKNNPTGTYNDLTGELKWEVKLKQKDSKEVSYDYEVVYPKYVNLRL